MSEKKETLHAIQEVLRQENLDAFIIPHSDPHQSEYLDQHWELIAWACGFTGSAGTLVVTPDYAGLWTDSRYFIQAAQQLSGTGGVLHKMHVPGSPSYVQWLKDRLPAHARIGLDTRLLSASQFNSLATTLAKLEPQWVSEVDLVGRLWETRPPLSANPVLEHELKYAGQSREEKIAAVLQKMQHQGASHHILSTLDEIAWLLNLRGSDIDFNPVFFAYLLLEETRPTLYVDEQKLTDPIKTALADAGLSLAPYDDIRDAIAGLPSGSKVLISPDHLNQQLVSLIPSEVEVLRQANPSNLLKACKNETERTCIHTAMRKDGVALVRFLRWLEQEVPKGKISELSAAQQLHAFRAEQEDFMGDSFPAISGYKGHGAIVHYSVNEESSSTLLAESLYLIDSGGQYLDGTTDITRTIALGTPNEAMRRDFTLVLKGHIQLAMVRFPQGTRGYQLDILARHALWQQGFNYGHGTGHGVGFFLNVHEGPQSISSAPKSVGLLPGMLISNEPGIYREEQYGIRIENLVLVQEDLQTEFGSFFSFETVSLCPIDLSLIEVSLLEPAEKNWLNQYHRQVYESLAPHLDLDEQEWLSNKTMPL